MACRGTAVELNSGYSCDSSPKWGSLVRTPPAGCGRRGRPSGQAAVLKGEGTIIVVCAGGSSEEALRTLASGDRAIIRAIKLEGVEDLRCLFRHLTRAAE